MRAAALLRAGALLAACAIGVTAGASEPRYTLVDFADLNGWAGDDHAAAFDTFLETCTDLTDPEWSKICAVATQKPNPRIFFESFFQPVLISDGADMLFTGYFEPELTGSRVQTERFATPIYALPPQGSEGRFATRREIEEGTLLAGRGLELAWVDDPVEAFFLQVQGSGRISLTDGDSIRVGFAGKNGHEYRSIGQELVRRGIYQPHEVSADVIKAWVARNPADRAELLWHNPSFVFFREVTDVPSDLGPLGAMNRSIKGLRTIAVDPAFTPLGAPVWIEKAGTDPLNRLMVAQDTGSAIKGAQRADIFYGTGAAAGRAAGRVRHGGRMVTLLPRQLAFALLPEELQ